MYASGVVNRHGCRIVVNKKWNLDKFQELLQGYEDIEIIEWLKYGWPINRKDTAPEIKSIPMNHKGAQMFPRLVDEYLAMEIEQGATMGPFDIDSFKVGAATSPINSRPKKDSDKRRFILDLSFPVGNSVNDGIPKDEYMGQAITLKYPTIDTLAHRIHQVGSQCKQFKIDMLRAFRQLYLDPISWRKIGMKWKGRVFYDKCTPMGLRSASIFCQRTTSGIKYAINRLNHFLMNYLDDLIGAEHQDRVEQAFRDLNHILNEVNIDISHNKTVAPCSIMEALGVWMDAEQQRMAVTPARVKEILTILEEWRHKTTCNIVQLQSLIGKLQFIAKCIRPGRVFIARLLNYLKGMKKGITYLISDEARNDIKWWYEFLPHFQGTVIMWMYEHTDPDTQIAVDACLQGAGGVSEKEYFHLAFPEKVQSEARNIANKELFTVILALKLWGHKYKDKNLL